MTLPIRKQNRKQGFDYSASGWYFITICTDKRIHYFGNIDNGIMQNTITGKIAHEYLLEIPAIYGSSVDIDRFVIMPNHIHAIIVLHENSPTISTIIKSYKQQVTKKVHEEGLGFSRQKSFHDHIIRNEEQLIRIQQYIINNPLQRIQDSLYAEV